MVYGRNGMWLSCARGSRDLTQCDYFCGGVKWLRACATVESKHSWTDTRDHWSRFYTSTDMRQSFGKKRSVKSACILRLASSACRTPKKLDFIDPTVNASFKVLTYFLIALHIWTQMCTFHGRGVGVGYAVVRWKSRVHFCVVCSFALLCNTKPFFITCVLKNLWVHILLLLS